MNQKLPITFPKILLAIFCFLVLFLSTMSALATTVLVSQHTTDGIPDSAHDSIGSSEWSQMTAAVEQGGANQVAYTPDLENLSLLLNYDALIVQRRDKTVGPNWDLSGQLSANEIANLGAYIETGRKVLMTGEWGGWPYGSELGWQYWNDQILGIVGGTYNSAYGDDPVAVSPIPVANHKLTKNVMTLDLYGNRYGSANGGLILFDPSFATLWKTNENVLTILDTGIFSDARWGLGDNGQFSLNVAEWLTTNLSPSWDAMVTTDLDYYINVKLSDTFSFDYWWAMGQEPEGFNLDILFFSGGEWKTFFGWKLNFDGSSTEWETASFIVPEYLRGLETELRFQVFDLGADTDPTVYLRNIASGTAPVPEPATMLLLASGLVGLAGLRRRLRKKEG